MASAASTLPDGDAAGPGAERTSPAAGTAARAPLDSTQVNSVYVPCEDLLLLKQGLDLRLKEFKEEKKRIEDIRWRLSRKFDERFNEQLLAIEDGELSSYSRPLRDREETRRCGDAPQRPDDPGETSHQCEVFPP